jgi:hypothetical protein
MRRKRKAFTRRRDDETECVRENSKPLWFQKGLNAFFRTTLPVQACVTVARQIAAHGGGERKMRSLRWADRRPALLPPFDLIWQHLIFFGWPSPPFHRRTWASGRPAVRTHR